MPYKRRVSKDRGEPQITPIAIDLYQRARQLQQRRKQSPETERELSDLSFRLSAELKLARYEEDPLDCDREQPPRWLKTEYEVEDYFRSRQIRQQLEQALKARRDSVREVERKAKAGAEAKATAPQNPGDHTEPTPTPLPNP
jgi:hypothetical protein